MPKELRELLNQLAAAQERAATIIARADATLEEVQAATTDINVIKAKIDAFNLVNDTTEPVQASPVMTPSDEGKLNYGDVFIKALQRKPLSDAEASLLSSQAALSSNVGEDGGYTIPVDQQTAINEIKRSLPSLESLVTVESVTTLTGSRIIEKDADSVPFQEFAEGDDVPASDTPQFVKIDYTIKDRGGILPIPNGLLADSAANIRKYLNKWLAKKQIATRNGLIMGLLNTLTKVLVDDFDDIKDILNETLDPAIEVGAVIATNQSGYNYLAKLKDTDGNYIMKRSVIDKNVYEIEGKPVKKFSNKVMPNRIDGANKKAPLIIGDLKEAVVLFDREQMSVLATNVGGDAFKKNRTDLRAITREDVKSFDTGAVVFGEIIVGTV